MAKALDSTTDMVIQGIFPWCFTPRTLDFLTRNS
jgi:hypothetical protein